jgi:fumarate hydratase subunit alpha
MRDISTRDITEKVRAACIEACTELPDDVLLALRNAREQEESPAGQDVLGQLIENAEIARKETMPICQDTGVALVFVEIGQEAHIVDGYLYDAINEGVRRGYVDGSLRKSIVRHPLDRVNTGDNTPAVIHAEVVPGDGLRILVAPKGAGSENMGAVKALKPSDGLEGVRRFVVETIVNAGPNPCPPLVVGVGIGGTLDKACILAKKAALRPIGASSANPVDRDLEAKLLEAANDTGVGPAGLGGRVTALAVHVESYPCHIGSMPVAVNLQCHAVRHKEVAL